MKFIIDQQLPPLLAEWLVGRGHEASHVQDLELGTSVDGVIWTLACEMEAIVISRDEDFVKLVRIGGGARLIWIRFGNCDNPTLFELLDRHWPAILDRFAFGDDMVELRR